MWQSQSTEIVVAALLIETCSCWSGSAVRSRSGGELAFCGDSVSGAGTVIDMPCQCSNVLKLLSTETCRPTYTMSNVHAVRQLWQSGYKEC